VYIDNDGVRIYYEAPGSGRRVVLLHGFPDDGRIWREQVPVLVRAGHQVIIPDLRGYGASDKPDDVAAYALPHLVMDVLAILDAVGARSASVVGHDQGAVLAWLLGAFAPERVDRLVAVSVGHPRAFLDAGIEQQRRSWYMLLFEHPDLGERWLSTHGAALLRSWGGHPDGDDVLDGLALSWYRANMPADVWVNPALEVPSVTAPTLGIFGVNDGALTAAQMRGSQQYVGGYWRYAEVEDAAHWPQVEQPKTVNELLTRFLRSPTSVRQLSQ
jgi:pimeloyl-ACP methyl ester carboxylesterase